MSRNAAMGAALAEAPLELDLERAPVAPLRRKFLAKSSHASDAAGRTTATRHHFKRF